MARITANKANETDIIIPEATQSSVIEALVSPVGLVPEVQSSQLSVSPPAILHH
jgi:hypothetical protein